MDILALALACAPLVSPGVMSGIVQAESGGNPWAIFRHDTHESIYPASEAEAVATMRRLLAQGVRIDAGLAQIDSAKWDGLKLSVDNVLAPCSNLGAAEELLVEAYRKDPGDLDAALSRFGTGDPAQGVKDGYVAAVRAGAKAAPGTMVAPAVGESKTQSAAGPEAPQDDTVFRGVPDGFASGR